MPEIPRFSPSRGLPGSAGFRRGGLDQAGAEGRALIHFGQVAGEAGLRVAGALGQAMARNRQRAAGLAAAEGLAEARVELTRSLVEAEAEADADPEGFVAGFTERAGVLLEQRLATAPEGARALLAPRFRVLQGEFEQRAILSGAKAAVRVAGRRVDNTVRLGANTARSDPSQFEPALAEALAAIDASGLPEANKATARELARLRTARSAVEGGIDADPGRTLAELNQGRFDDFLTPEAKDTLLTEAQAEIERRKREAGRRDKVALRRLRGAIKDEVASLEQSGRVVPGVVGQARLLLDDAEFDDFMAERELAADTFRTVDGLRFATPAEISATLAGLKPEAGVPGFARDQALFERATRAAEAIGRARAADPAAFAQTAPEVADAFAAADDDAGLRAAIEMRLAAQAEIGVPPEAIRVTSKAEAKAQAAELSAAPGLDRADKIEALKATLGSNFGRAMVELADAGLDSRTVLLASLDGDRLLIQQFAQVIDTGRDELRQGLEKTAVGEIETGVRAALGDFGGAFAAADFTGGNIDQFNDMAELLVDYALLLHRQGQDVGSAVAAAARVIADRFEVLGGARFKAFVPLTLDGRAVDVRKVEALAEARINRAFLEGVDLLPFGRLGVSVRTPAEEQEALLDAVAAGGFWATSAAGDALVLMIRGNNGAVAPLRRFDGSPVTVGFLEATDLPLATAPAGARPPRPNPAARRGAPEPVTR